MSAVAELREALTARLYSEALALDERRWDDWLDHYTADCVYWVPAWKSEDEQTGNPRRELSLIYYTSRAALADRVWRVKSGTSNASAVLPRTQHAISNVQIQSHADAQASVRCNWTVHQYLPKEKAVEVFFGRYEMSFVFGDREGDGAWRIATRKTVLLNDLLPAKIDFYSL